MFGPKERPRRSGADLIRGGLGQRRPPPSAIAPASLLLGRLAGLLVALFVALLVASLVALLFASLVALFVSFLVGLLAGPLGDLLDRLGVQLGRPSPET